MNISRHARTSTLLAQTALSCDGIMSEVRKVDTHKLRLRLPGVIIDIYMISVQHISTQLTLVWPEKLSRMW